MDSNDENILVLLENRQLNNEETIELNKVKTIKISMDYNQFLDNLPSNIVNIIIDFHYDDGYQLHAPNYNQPLEYLPPTLETLYLNVESYNYHFDLLPIKLKKFTLIINRNHNLTDMDFCNLPLELEKLGITIYIKDGKLLNMNNLPDSIKVLYICVTNFDTIYKLPASLEELIITNFSFVLEKITNIRSIHLVKRIKQITLQGINFYTFDICLFKNTINTLFPNGLNTEKLILSNSYFPIAKAQNVQDELSKIYPNINIELYSLQP